MINKRLKTIIENYDKNTLRITFGFNKNTPLHSTTYMENTFNGITWVLYFYVATVIDSNVTVEIETLSENFKSKRTVFASNHNREITSPLLTWYFNKLSVNKLQKVMINIVVFYEKPTILLPKVCFSVFSALFKTWVSKYGHLYINESTIPNLEQTPNTFYW